MTHSQFHCMYLVLILTHPRFCIPFIILATLQTHTITIICNSHFITNHKYLSHQPTLWHRFDVHKGISASHGYWPLTHWGRDKMAAFSQTTLSNAFSCLKIFEFRLKIYWSLFLRVELTIFQHWFRKWLRAVQATSHYLNQWWLVCRRIYASLGLNELNGRSRTKPNLVIIMSADAITPTGTRLSADTARQRETFYFNISMALDNFGYSYRSGNMIHNGRKRLRKVSRLFEC